jgi:putative IMPACT (imprinted ancient) family translation regulator
VPEIVHGAPVVDRKSKFVAHAAIVHTRADVDAVIDALTSDKRIATATHNISAYRIALAGQTRVDGTVRIDQERDDDGETGAGDKLLFLLKQRGEVEVVVVVSRWFGGIQLGPDRFKHIATAARDILDSSALARLRTKKPTPRH